MWCGCESIDYFSWANMSKAFLRVSCEVNIVLSHEEPTKAMANSMKMVREKMKNPNNNNKIGLHNSDRDDDDDRPNERTLRCARKVSPIICNRIICIRRSTKIAMCTIYAHVPFGLLPLSRSRSLILSLFRFQCIIPSSSGNSALHTVETGKLFQIISTKSHLSCESLDIEN